MPSKGGSRASHGTIAVADGDVSVHASGRSGPALAVAQAPEVPEAVLAVVASTPIVDDEPPVDTPEWAELYSRAVARYQEQRERTDREQEQAQRLWDEFLRIQGQEVPEGERSLVASEALHRELKRLAMTGQAAGYEHENVIGDPNQTFGIEIEFDGADPNAVARALHEAGLSSSARQEPYHSSSRVAGKWTLEHDATVSGEVVSPVLQDTPEAWAQLERVCQILQAHGARATGRTGGHVHVGVDSAGMDHDVNKFRRVAKVCAWAEDLMYRLAAATGQRGRSHRGSTNGYRWCGPMGSGQFEEVQGLSDLANRVGSSHSVGLNFGNILDRNRTIEYRYFDSSLDPVRLQANIKLACWVTKRAAELPDAAIPQERHALGSHRSPRDPDDGDRLLRRFADLIFVRPQDKLKLYWVYQRSAWQRTRRGAAA
jgi:Putative amidoligase enzyme